RATAPRWLESNCWVRDGAVGVRRERQGGPRSPFSLGCLGHPIGLEAPGADAQPPRRAAHHGAHALQIRIPAPVRLVVRVAGVVRRTSHDSYERIGHLLDRVHIVPADLLDQHSLTSVVRDARPDEVYNLAAQSFVPTSWTQPVLTGEFTALGVTRLLEAVRLAHPTARFYQASSSEMFGKAQEAPQRETTPFYPRSPYGVAK